MCQAREASSMKAANAPQEANWLGNSNCSHSWQNLTVCEMNCWLADAWNLHTVCSRAASNKTKIEATQWESWWTSILSIPGWTYCWFLPFVACSRISWDVSCKAATRLLQTSSMARCLWRSGHLRCRRHDSAGHENWWILWPSIKANASVLGLPAKLELAAKSKDEVDSPPGQQQAYIHSQNEGIPNETWSQVHAGNWREKAIQGSQSKRTKIHTSKQMALLFKMFESDSQRSNQNEWTKKDTAIRVIVTDNYISSIIP